MFEELWAPPFSKMPKKKRALPYKDRVTLCMCQAVLIPGVVRKQAVRVQGLLCCDPGQVTSPVFAFVCTAVKWWEGSLPPGAVGELSLFVFFRIPWVRGL